MVRLIDVNVNMAYILCWFSFSSPGHDAPRRRQFLLIQTL
jgi:hypothetical protein